LNEIAPSGHRIIWPSEKQTLPQISQINADQKTIDLDPKLVLAYPMTRSPDSVIPITFRLPTRGL